jgi:hypothetical protein|nr:MAG TPA: nucelotide kinase [Caudoviricetes sp.]
MVSEMAEHKGEIKMIKIYKVNTFEKLEYLLNTLHERGAKWCDGESLDNKKAIHNIWGVWGDGVFIYKMGETVTFSRLGYIEQALEVFENKGEYYTIIEDVKLPKPKEKPKASEAQQAQPHQTNVIQPGHYNQGDMDLFEIFYHQYPFNEFRTGMRMIAARYYHRYPDKNGLQDYAKGDEVMRRLREYEEREANGR